MPFAKPLHALRATLLLFSLSACSSPSPPLAALPAGCVVSPPPGIGGPLALIDEGGGAVTQAAFAGKPTLVYFGYTFCPDVCPLSMQSESLALQELGPAAQDVQRVLITLDPDRDTPQALARYVKSGGFPEGLRGLTGTPEQTAAVAKAFKVGWRKAGEGKDYTLDHTSFFYLMDKQWRLKALYPSDLAPQDAATCLKAGLG